MKAIISVILLLVVSCATAQKHKNDWTTMNLKGKVKQMVEGGVTTVFNAKGNRIMEKSAKDSTVYLYDSKDNFTGHYYYKMHRNLPDEYSRYTYDSKGNKIRSNWYNYEDINSKVIYKYDAKGNLAEEYIYNDNRGDKSLKERDTYRHDSKGNLIENYWYNPDGSLERRYVYKYDSTGLMTEEVWYDKNNKLETKYTYRYDDYGNKTEENVYKGDGSLDHKYTCRYDYDKSLNWINRYRSENNKPDVVTEREINYF
jgi:hypothetical protein